jgi:hypothetical protein
LIVYKAAIAYSMSGPAALRSLSVSVCFFVTSSWIFKHLAFSISALSFSISTLSLSLDTTSSIFEASYLVTSASAYFILTSSSITATTSYVWFWFNLTRHVYTTPKTFLELIKLFTGMLNKKKDSILANKERYETGLVKLNQT